MGAGLTLLSDDELTRLRGRVANLAQSAKPEQRVALAQRLEDIDIERDRRLAVG